MPASTPRPPAYLTTYLSQDQAVASGRSAAACAQPDGTHIPTRSSPAAAGTPTAVSGSAAEPASAGRRAAMTAQEPSPAGTQRRLRALMCRGWSPEAIERATGIPATQTARALTDRRGIGTEAAANVASAYDQLWDRPPPQATDTRTAASPRRRPPRHGPATGHRPWRGTTRTSTATMPRQRPVGDAAAARRSAPPRSPRDAAYVREHGGYRHATNKQVAMRLGVSPARLEKAISRPAQADYDREAV